MFDRKNRTDRGLKHRLTIGAKLMLAASPNIATAEPGGRRVSEDKSTLTNLATVAAVPDSSNELVNMIGRPATKVACACGTTFTAP